MLTTNKYVIVYCLDFSKAFDSVRHSTLFNKYADLDLPDYIYNWLESFFHNRSHCTQFGLQLAANDGVPSSPGRYAVIGCKLKQNANEGCNSCASLAGLVLCLIFMFYFTCDRSLTLMLPLDSPTDQLCLVITDIKR